MLSGAQWRLGLARRLPVYYGWVIFAMASVPSFGARPVASVAVLSVFVVPMADEFGWSRGFVSGAVSLGAVGGLILSPVAGRLIDRYGSSVIVAGCSAVVGSCALALGLVALSWWSFYAIYVPGRAVFSSPLELSTTTAVSNWFIRRRALALAAFGALQGIGLGTLPLVAAALIGVFDWRTAWATLGAVTLVSGIIPPLLLMARCPEDMQLEPDPPPHPSPRRRERPPAAIPSSATDAASSAAIPPAAAPPSATDAASSAAIPPPAASSSATDAAPSSATIPPPAAAPSSATDAPSSPAPSSTADAASPPAAPSTTDAASPPAAPSTTTDAASSSATIPPANPPPAATLWSETDYTVREALATPAFWILAAFSALGFIVQAGVSLHQVPHYIGVGVPTPLAAFTSSAFAVGQIPGGIILASLGRRVPVRALLAAAALIVAAGALGTGYSSGLDWGIPSGFTLGAGVGGLHSLLRLAWADYYGRRHLGAIRGLTLPAQIGGQAIGPVVAGFMFDATGGYRIPFTIFGVVVCFGAAMVLAARPPVPVGIRN